ncbi:MAG: DUF4491 family protein [Bacteroidales bacterium]|nr:DUF4491 family protein [Bacteroidales bacterium]
MEWLNEYHLGGIAIGICTFLIIGLFHPIVVKAEYYWGTRCWWLFLILGIAGMAGTLLVGDILISSLLGVFAFSSFWTIKEIFEQQERVLKGWFPMNPKRKQEYERVRQDKGKA